MNRQWVNLHTERTDRGWKATGRWVEESLIAKLQRLLNAGDAACLNGTPMIPLHRNTVAEIVAALSCTNCGEPAEVEGHCSDCWNAENGQFGVGA